MLLFRDFSPFFTYVWGPGLIIQFRFGRVALKNEDAHEGPGLGSHIALRVSGRLQARGGGVSVHSAVVPGSGSRIVLRVFSEGFEHCVRLGYVPGL